MVLGMGFTVRNRGENGEIDNLLGGPGGPGHV